MGSAIACPKPMWDSCGVPRPLPITEFAHKATVIGNAPVPAVLHRHRRGRQARPCRQFSIADMTFELGQAQVTGLSGTIAGAFSSEDIGDLDRGAQAALAAGILALHQYRQTLQRTGHRADRLGRDTRIERDRIKLAVAQPVLDEAQIGAGVEQVGGKAVAQRVRSDPLGDLRGLCRIDDDAMELPGSPTWRLLICALLPSAWFRVSHLLYKRR